MIDIIARLLISLSILIGTTYLPTLSAATGFAQAAAPDGAARTRRACPARHDAAIRACTA